MRAVERFVQVETGLRRSKLVDRLRECLGTSTAQTIGHLVLLWSAALDARTGGDLSERSDRWIEDEAGWQGEPGAFAACIRQWHLDERGVIRDFEAKYGKLDVDRRKATEVKREQRRRERGDSPADVPEVSTGQTEDRPAISSISQSVSRSGDLVLGKGEPEREGEYNPEIEHPVELIEARFGGYARPIVALVRASRNPDAVAATICSHLDGMHGAAYTPEVIALAATEWAASGEEKFNSRHFAGFVRRAEGTVRLAASRRQQQNETRFIRAEVEEQSSIDAELAAERALIERFEREHPAEHRDLANWADLAIDAKWKGVIRENMVRAELAKRIAKWLDDNGGARAAS